MVMKCDVLSVTVNINQFGCFLPDGILDILTLSLESIIINIVVRLNNLYHLIIYYSEYCNICLFIKILSVTVTIAALHSTIIFIYLFESYFHNNLYIF